MESLKTAAKQTVTSFTSSAKVADLQKNIVEPTSGCPMRNDHGVLVSDTDNWFVTL